MLHKPDSHFKRKGGRGSSTSSFTVQTGYCPKHALKTDHGLDPVTPEHRRRTSEAKNNDKEEKADGVAKHPAISSRQALCHKTAHIHQPSETGLPLNMFTTFGGDIKLHSSTFLTMTGLTITFIWKSQEYLLWVGQNITSTTGI